MLITFHNIHGIRENFKTTLYLKDSKTTKNFSNTELTNYIVRELGYTNKWKQMLGKINTWDMTENKEKRDLSKYTIYFQGYLIKT